MRCYEILELNILSFGETWATNVSKSDTKIIQTYYILSL